MIASLTDHNSVDNVPEFLDVAGKNGITAISGVEISCKEDDIVYHVLAYGFNPGDKRVAGFVDPLLAMMKSLNFELIGKMSFDYDEIDIDEYREYTYDRTRGGWESVNYLFDKGIAPTPVSALSFYKTYDCLLSNCDYPTPGEVFKQVHSWEAYPILAHPSYYIDQNSVTADEITSMLDNLKIQGLAGVECYYPTHNELMTGTTLKWCMENNMMITVGCDSHGTFVPERGIGTMRVPLSKINIDSLLRK
jgi:hypothetical protein